MQKRLRHCTEPFRAAVYRLGYLALAVTVTVPGSDDSLLVSALAVWAQPNHSGPGCLRRVFFPPAQLFHPSFHPQEGYRPHLGTSKEQNPRANYRLEACHEPGELTRLGE